MQMFAFVNVLNPPN